MVKDLFSINSNYDILGNPIRKINKREPISQSQRNEILARQKNKCNRCKKLLDMRAKHFDHIKEVYKGGKSRIDNLQALCANCHNIKTHDEKLHKVEKRRKNNSSDKGDYIINPLTGKKEKINVWKI